MDEGLGKVGEGAFQESTVENVRLPSTLKRIEANTLYYCKNLRDVVIPSGVEHIGKECFRDSGVEKIVLPGTLREINEKVFDSCSSLKVIFVERRCQVDVRKYVGDSVTV